jgi:hypothetical protein
MSLDGFVAPEERRDDPDVQRWMAQWMELQQWIFPQRFFREDLKLGEGGEEGRDNEIVRETFERAGASVKGKRMFDLGEKAWPEEAPFHTPVFVVTHEKRDLWERPDGTTFHFVNDGIETALDQARRAAGDRDVRIAGGGATILEYVNAGLRRVLDRALTRAVRLRNPPVRGRGRGPRGPGAGPRGADAAGDPPDLRSPAAVTGLTPALPAGGQQRGEILDALSVTKGRAFGPRSLPRAPPGGTSRSCRGTSSPAQASPASHQAPRLPRGHCRGGVRSSNQHGPDGGLSTRPSWSRRSVPVRYSRTASSSNDPIDQRAVISKSRDTPIHRSWLFLLRLA